jgi:5-hydroxyisourate hydrolase-like protein (transthyretin family)
VRIRRIGQSIVAVIFLLFSGLQAPCFAADSTGQLKVTVRDLNGQPTKDIYVTLWREIDAQSGERRYFDFDWTDSAGRCWRSGRYWSAGGGSGFPDLFDKLLPGNYRVTAMAYVKDLNDRTFGRVDPTPYGTSQPVVVTGDVPTTEVVIEFKGGAPLTVEVVDKVSGKPIGNARVRLLGPDGEPIGLILGDEVDAEGIARFSQLPPGDYEVEALGCYAHRYAAGVADYLPLPQKLPAKVESGKENSLRIEMASKPLATEEIERRWPYEYFGCVTDVDGKPLTNVSIEVFSGLATCFCVAETKTDTAGKYRVRFAPGAGIASDGWIMAGLVYAKKPGWGEVTNQRPGNLQITARKEAIAPEGYDLEKLVAPREPKQVDFVMAPLRKFSGRLVDQADAPIAGIKITLEGQPEPPGYGDWRAATTDADGRFQFDDAAPVGEFKLSAIFGDEAYQKTSTELKLTNRGDYRLDLKIDRGLTVKASESQ